MSWMPRLPELSLLVWNLEFRRRDSADGRALRAAIEACAPDIACITEAAPDILDLPHVIEAAADYGYGPRGSRRKVMLFSRQPWTQVDALGDPAMPPGRYVAGRTATPLGEVALHGLCIPWSHAHVATGRRDAKPWGEHLRYLEGLARVLARPVDVPCIACGDYNQAIPRRRAPLAVHQALLAAFPPALRHLTTGELPPLGRQVIDHVSATGLAARSLRLLSNTAADGRQLTDHLGVHVVLARGMLDA
jgi:endonuclease/exonuclease/phosphatase family metal-dependent hydrolase